MGEVSVLVYAPLLVGPGGVGVWKKDTPDQHNVVMCCEEREREGTLEG